MASAVKMLRTDMGPDELKPMIRKWINDNRKDHPPRYPIYMNRIDTKDAYFEDMELGQFGSIPRKDEGDYINFAVPPTGNKTLYQPDTFQLAFAISYEDRMHNRIGKVQKYTRSLDRAARHTAEQIAAIPFNLGFSASFRGNDGQPLFSTSHVLVSGGVVSNTAAVDLTIDTLEAAVGTFISMVGNDGFPIDMSPQFLVVHPSNLLNAQRIVGSPNYFPSTAAGVPNGADTGVPNVLKKFGLTVVSNPYLTDPDAWFLLAGKSEHEINMVWGETPKDRSFMDQYNEDMVYSLRFMATSGFSTFIGAWGSPGA